MDYNDAHVIDDNESITKMSKDNIQILVETNDVINYAIQQNGGKVIRNICIKNLSENEYDNLIVKISSDNDFINISYVGVQNLKAKEELNLKDINININGDYLASLTERVTCSLRFAVYMGDEEVTSVTSYVVALAYDQWPGLKYTPEILTAFSMPNHPVIINLIQLASQYLEKWTGNPSLAGYQIGGSDRIKQMAAAAFAAIQKNNITYANPPSSFEEFGQRIRLADAVLDQHLGTCMDLTLIYVACLEAMGLNSIMVLMRGHIFAGVWLIEDSFPDTVMDDPSQLEKRMANGINEILVVECTSMCAGKVCEFDEAVKIAQDNVSNYAEFEFAIDVTRARSFGVRPLPVRVKTDTGFVIEHKDRIDTEITNKPNQVGETFDLSNLQTESNVTKQLQWERKLLDLSLRNMLINLRFTKAVVPLLCSSVSMLEDSLSDGEEFKVLCRPDNMSVSGDGGIPIEAITNLGEFEEFIELEGKHKRLHSFYTEKELNSCLTKIYRSAKSSMEENGASTLYLALGLLRWMESAKSTVVRYAPIILLPIDITRKTANKGYVMRMRDEDAQINITLLEFLKQNYDVKIDGLDPLPTDDHGLDLPKIFAIIRHGVMSMPMWDVVEGGLIGNFSFSQFVMWNDIHNNCNMLEKNDIVRSLIKGAVDWKCDIPAEVETDEAYLPVTADASQLRAINMAANNVSFVLHGPPGTGKSQTITAMIANALTKGKTVLFVAEKMAALEVVQKRLDALGIGDFCLELHSNKATKKAVLDQLRKNLEISVYGMKTEYDEKIQNIHNMKSELDSYVKKLYERRTFGKSVKELIDIYETIPDNGIEVKFSIDYAGKITQAELDNQRRSLEQLIAAGKEIGNLNNHPLAAIKQTIYTQSLRMDLEEAVSDYKNVLMIIRKDVDLLISIIKLEKPVSESEWRNIESIAKSIIDADTIPEFLFNADNIDKEFDPILEYINDNYVLMTRKSNLCNIWNESFLCMDMDKYRIRLGEANKKFFGKSKAINLIVSEIQSFAKCTINETQLPLIFADIEMYQKQVVEVEKKKSSLAFEWKQIIEKYNTPDELKSYKEQLRIQRSLVDKYRNLINSIRNSGDYETALECSRHVVNDFEELTKSETKLGKILNIDFGNSDGNWIDCRENLCHMLVDNASDIKDWIIFRQSEDACKKQGLGDICEVYENGLPNDQVMNVYLRSIYKAIIISVIENEPVLNGFTGNGFNEKILQFKKLDDEFMQLTKDEMIYKLTHNLPSPYESVEMSKELNILRRAISSNGRGITIRSLFEQIPNILKKLTPCMLMSPISVAQYLSFNVEPYDIVIFDEASQLPTCKAVGVLARGKNAVIVGDPNQMPPTSFFAGNTVDEDNLDIEDLDSILDDCLALGMPSTHLQWHYRSRHESLIAFSNTEFYENSMLTFPSVNDREKCVSLIKVDSFFDRKNGRINAGEAKAIVEEIKRRYKDPELTNMSIGVVTFNISQQTLIQDMLQEEFSKDFAFDKWASEGEESLFVKNLENVQGDERDVILFSVSFGPDEDGKLLLNFGPLNKQGGWKRLNVAVSRARYEMIVFSTMTSDMIDLKRTKSKGVESLKNFLEYAEKGKLHIPDISSFEKERHGILDCICSELEKAGYKYQIDVGHSKFKVDIAVLNPFNEDEYLLGILLDGDTYRQSVNTKDREISQINVLTGLGWKLHRIWTMDWWDNSKKEIEKLLDKLNDLVYDEHHENSEEEKQDFQLTNEEIVNEPEPSTIKKMSPFGRIDNTDNMNIDTEKIKNIVVSSETDTKEKIIYSVIDYESADIGSVLLSSSEYSMKEHFDEIVDRIQAIVDVEAPISYDNLLKRTLRSFGIARSGNSTIETTDKALKKVNAKIRKQNNIRFYWKNDQNPDTYGFYRNDQNQSDKRAIDEISQQEIKNAVCITLESKGSLAKDELVKETIRTMGYARSGTALVEAVERGIKYGRKTGEIMLSDNKKYIIS